MTNIEMCRLAIVAYWRAFYKALGFVFRDEKVRRYAQQDATTLAESEDEGIRYGAPGWPRLKLHFTGEHQFYLESNGMDHDEFLAFQELVAEQFAKDGLPFALRAF